MSRANETTEAAHVLPALTAEGLRDLGDAAVVIDLRSPREFAEDHVPGAFNVPLFDDDERALVGTLYRQTSPSAAFDAARRIVQDKVAAFVDEIARVTRGAVSAGSPGPPTCSADEIGRHVAHITDGGLAGLERALICAPVVRMPARPIVFHCWRGGFRSRSVVALVRLLGIDDALVLTGGYRAWRALVVHEIDAFAAPRTFTLRGLTGVGKTRVLHALERLRPGTTIDLEGLAQHRSSILGHVGLAPRGQKAFESALFTRMRAGFGAALVVEGESRKVGDVIVPRALWNAMESATHVELVAPLDRRVALLREEYAVHPARSDELEAPLAFLDARLRGTPTLRELYGRGEIETLVARLLVEYYDPLYRHGEQGRVCSARFDATDPERCAFAIAAMLDADRERRGRGDLVA